MTAIQAAKIKLLETMIGNAYAANLHVRGLSLVVIDFVTADATIWAHRDPGETPFPIDRKHLKNPIKLTHKQRAYLGLK